MSLYANIGIMFPSSVFEWRAIQNRMQVNKNDSKLLLINGIVKIALKLMPVFSHIVRKVKGRRRENKVILPFQQHLGFSCSSAC